MIEKTVHYPLIKFSYNTKILSKSTDARIYRNAIILTPGEFSDSISKAPAVYSEYNLSKSASIWSKNYLNLDHSFETLKRLGYVTSPHWKNNAVVGDLNIFPITQASRDTIALIDAGLINWLSAEIKSEDYWDPKDNKRYAGDIEFIGAAIVTHPADINTRIVSE